MKNFLLFLAILISFNIGKESNAIKKYSKCAEKTIVSNNNVNGPKRIINVGDDAILFSMDRSLHRSERYRESHKPIPADIRALHSDKYGNILIFIGDNKMYNYSSKAYYVNLWRMPSSELPKSDGSFKGDTFAFDNQNHIYAVSTKGIVHKRHGRQYFQLNNELSRYNNVSLIAESKDDTFYFVFNHPKTSWIIDGSKGSPIFQSTPIKGIHYYQDPSNEKSKSLFYLDNNCALNKISLDNFKLGKTKKIHVMFLEGCGEDKKFMFSLKGRLYVFHENKLLNLSKGLDEICVHAELPAGVTIYDGVVSYRENDVYLVTSRGIWQVRPDEP